jgi:phytoene/squalene synthetase
MEMGRIGWRSPPSPTLFDVSQLTHVYRPLAKNAAGLERSNLPQIVLAEGVTMTDIQYLRYQASRAERLARSVMDTLTVDRLQAFAADCRAQAEALNAAQQPSQLAMNGLGQIVDRSPAA